MSLPSFYVNSCILRWERPCRQIGGEKEIRFAPAIIGNYTIPASPQETVVSGRIFSAGSKDGPRTISTKTEVKKGLYCLVCLNCLFLSRIS